MSQVMSCRIAHCHPYQAILQIFDLRAEPSQVCAAIFDLQAEPSQVSSAEAKAYVYLS